MKEALAILQFSRDLMVLTDRKLRIMCGYGPMPQDGVGPELDIIEARLRERQHEMPTYVATFALALIDAHREKAGCEKSTSGRISFKTEQPEEAGL